MRSFSTFALVLVALAGCDSDDGGNGRADSGPIAACDCMPPEAADVSYSSTSSSLESDNVQDAIDELASRPDPISDLAMRIEIVEKTEMNDDAGATALVQAFCPPGGRALGGACVGDIGTSLQGTNVAGRQYDCGFNKEPGTLVQLTAKVICLMSPE